MDSRLVPRSLVCATGIDVLPPERVVTRRDSYLVVRSPTNPTHYWGNLLVFDDAPGPGDGSRWEALFGAEFADDPRVTHRTFIWDRTDDERGEAQEEFAARGYEVELSVGMLAGPDEIRPHPRANPDVEVRALDPRVDGPDEPLWQQVLEIHVAARDAERFSEEEHRVFSEARQAELRAMFRAGAGAWYGALDGDIVVGLLGIVVADPDYHAAAIYESVGFRAVERVCGVCRGPGQGRTGP